MDQDEAMERIRARRAQTATTKWAGAGPLVSLDTVDTTEQTAACVDCGTPTPKQFVVLPTGTVLGLSAARRAWLCPSCQGERDHKDAEQARQDRRAVQRITGASLTVPPLYARASFDTWDVIGNPGGGAGADEQAKTLQRALQGRGLAYLSRWPTVPPMLVLRGEPGTGKGHWLWSVARALAAEGVSARVTKLSDLIRRLRSRWGGGKRDEGEAEDRVLAEFRGLDWLAIDEVSRHAFYGESIAQHLYDVIDHRMEWGLPTILTSNETVADLAAILRPALWDRLHDGGGVIDFGAVSHRKGKRV